MSSQKNDNIIHHLATREIRAIMGDTTADGRNMTPASTQRFMTKKGKENYMVKYKRQFSKFLVSSTDELRRIHPKYPQHCVSRDTMAQDRMWACALKIHSSIISNDKRKNVLEVLYENFLLLEQKRFVSMPNFERCLKESLGYNIGGIKFPKSSHITETLYITFDVLCKGEFDWRRFLFYLHFASNPTLPCKDHLLAAFSIIASKDGLDPTAGAAKPSIDIKDIGMILFPLVRADATNDILDLFDAAWARLMAEKQSSSTNITSNVFEQILEQESMHELFGQSDLPWGRGRIFPVFICNWEEEIYNDALLNLVKDRRRENSVREKLLRDNMKTKRRVWKQWADFMTHRRTLRLLLNTVNWRAERRLALRGLSSFSQWTIKQNSVLTIQRVGRGFLGRIDARIRWIIRDSAILIQAHFRRCLARNVFQNLWANYQGSAIEIQRHIRGALGRRLALNRLLTRVAEERAKNQREKEWLEALRGEWSLTKLQSFFRREKAKAYVQSLRLQRQRERDVHHAMQKQSEKFRRERKIYERQLEQFYRTKKEEYVRNEQVQAKVVQDQIKIRTLRRRMQHEELTNLEPGDTEQLLMEKWRMEWESKIENGVEEIKVHYNHCLERPDNSIEKKIGAKLRKRIKGRVAEVLARADSRGIPMETKEAREVAKAEIIYIVGEEERERLRKEMERAFRNREKEKKDAMAKARKIKEQASARSELHAVKVVSKACRKWLARKELRRLCLERFEKKYDVEYHTFYYTDTRTNESSWTKPKAMGVFDIPIKDEWMLLRDAHDFPYYFNPCLMEMRWNPPPNEDMCCGMVHHTWWREYPVRLGQCPCFATVLNEDDGKRYCQECFARIVDSVAL